LRKPRSIKTLIFSCATGLYDVPRANALTGTPSSPDYTAIIDAVARREKARFPPVGITAASQLGPANAVPAKVTVHADARLRPIHFDSLVINFKPTAPSRLYWAGRPAIRIVQALHWLHDMLPADGDSILKRIRGILDDPNKERRFATVFGAVSMRYQGGCATW
jgi:hypothetical protein